MDRLLPELPVEERELVRGLRQFIALRRVAAVGIIATLGESPIIDDQRGSKFSFMLPKSLSKESLKVAPNE